jgi:hypothetical protein
MVARYYLSLVKKEKKIMKLKSGSKGDLVETLQRRLNVLGFKPGPIDGVFGPKTKKAVTEFQKHIGMATNGIVDMEIAAQLKIDAILQIPEPERRQYHSLITMNPNYFGNFPASAIKAKKKLSFDTRYEEISCVGFNPDRDCLEATVLVKLPYGYGGNLCGDGTLEYVRFFLDYGDGWEDVGVVAFTAHDLPNTTDCADRPDKPLAYGLSLPIEPRRHVCDMPILPKVRAILSWETMPPEGDPEWPPVWGNVVERYIQIRPYPKLVFKMAALETQKPIALPDLTPEDYKDIQFMAPKVVPEEKLPVLSTTELAQSYAGKVEPHRFGTMELHSALAAHPTCPSTILSKKASWKALGLDWSAAAGMLQKTSANTDYEELECVGLDDNRQWLEAVVHIKRPAGYSGDLCSNGSWEYVAFWADWEDQCEWTYLGTVKVKVHDIDEIPDEGLRYAVIMSVNLNGIRSTCDTPKISRVRAVLSWNTPPSTTDPDDLKYWGNRRDAHVQIQPGEIDDGETAKISILGGVPLKEINTSTNGRTISSALMVPWGTPADSGPWTGAGRECPFGGQVTIFGPSRVGRKYRISVRQQGSSDIVIVNNRIRVVDENGYATWHYADPATGFFDYLSDADNQMNLLGGWYTGSNNGLWQIRLEMGEAGPGGTITVIDTSPWYRIRLDNTKPDASIDIDGGACDEYVPGTPINGTFVARDTYFGHFRLDTLPLSMSPPRPQKMVGGSPVGDWGNDPSPGSTPDQWQLDTSGMTPCGYVVRLRVWDRSIVGSRPGNHNRARDDKGFCLLEELP